MRGQWLFHPDSPGELVFVVRGFWGRLLKPRHFATQRETRIYHLMCGKPSHVRPL